MSMCLDKVGFGLPTVDESGIHDFSAHQRSIQVCHLTDGRVAVSFVETGKETVVFHLSAEQACSFARLLMPAA